MNRTRVQRAQQVLERLQRITTNNLELAILRELEPTLVNELVSQIEAARVKLYGKDWEVRECVICWLFKLVENKGYQAIERLSGLPHSNFTQWFGAIRSAVKPFLQQYWAVSQIPEERFAISNQFSNGIPELQDATVIVDGIHFRVADRKENDGNVGYSFKKKKLGCSFAVFTDLSGMIIFVSKVYPANYHDVKVFRECFEEFCVATGFDKTREKIIADAGYTGIDPNAYCGTVVIKKKPPRGQLSSMLRYWLQLIIVGEDKEFNARISSVRVRIEQKFAHVTNKFKVMSSCFHGHVERFEEMVRCCFALWERNEELRHLRVSSNLHQPVHSQLQQQTPEVHLPLQQLDQQNQIFIQHPVTPLAPQLQGSNGIIHPRWPALTQITNSTMMAPQMQPLPTVYLSQPRLELHHAHLYAQPLHSLVAPQRALQMEQPVQHRTWSNQTWFNHSPGQEPRNHQQNRVSSHDPTQHYQLREQGLPSISRFLRRTTSEGAGCREIRCLDTVPY